MTVSQLLPSPLDTQLTLRCCAATDGDMGVYSYNNMGNLYEETSLNETADLILHAGDHCYNEGDDDESRADAYMQAFEKTTANSLWMPIVGNHEFYAGTNLSRYLDSTWQKWGPIPGGEEWGHPEEGLGGATSATSALGAMLSTGAHHGPGVHAKVRPTSLVPRGTCARLGRS
jgi:hypothetical protein